MSSPTLDDLRHFEAAIRTGSISRASRELGVTQQAVSYRVRGLERSLGLILVHRSPFGTTTTEVGETVYAAAQEVLAAATRLDATAARLRDEAAIVSLSVGASQTIASHLLPSWVMELRQHQQERGSISTAIELRTANSEEVMRLVRNGDVDLGFIEQPNTPDDLGSVTVGHDHMVVAVAPGHPWSTRESISLMEVAGEPLVARELGSGTRSTFEAAVLRELGRPAAQPLLVLATEAAVRSAVSTGAAPAVLSSLTVCDDVRLNRIVAVPFEQPEITRPFTAIWKGSQRDLFGAARELVSVASAAASRASSSGTARL